MDEIAFALAMILILAVAVGLCRVLWRDRK